MEHNTMQNTTFICNLDTLGSSFYVGRLPLSRSLQNSNNKVNNIQCVLVFAGIFQGNSK